MKVFLSALEGQKEHKYCDFIQRFDRQNYIEGMAMQEHYFNYWRRYE